MADSHHICASVVFGRAFIFIFGKKSISTRQTAQVQHISALSTASNSLAPVGRHISKFKDDEVERDKNRDGDDVAL